MAVSKLLKFPIVLFLFSITWLPAQSQQFKVVLFDLATKGDNYVLSNQLVIDSVDVLPSPAIFTAQNQVLLLNRTGDSTTIVSYDLIEDTIKTLYTTSFQLKSLSQTPDQKFISALQEDGNTTSLVKLANAGGEAKLILNSPEFSNYLWLDENAMLIVEPGKPNALSLLTLKPQKKIPIANNVGETLAQSGKQTYAFVHKTSVDTWHIKVLKHDGSIEIDAETIPEAEVFARTSVGDYLIISEGNLFSLRKPERLWHEVITETVVEEFVSINVNSSGTKLIAIVKKHN